MEKIMELHEAAGLVTDGDKLAISGNMEMAPMALIREIIKQQKKHLNLVCVPSSAIGVDLFIGSGLADSVEFAQIALGEYGMAPHFRAAAESGKIKTLDHV